VGTVRSDTGEVRYLVLAECAAPYLLARVRWPDVAQAITAGCPDWLEDPGLFDLPYEPHAVAVSFAQAASVAAGWGRQLSDEPAMGAPAMMRRMPANWSDLSPSERDALGLEPLGRRRVSARRLHRLRASQAQASTSVPVAAPPGGYAAVPNPYSRLATTTVDMGNDPPERRRRVRVRVDGRAHLGSAHATVSAALVDLSEGGVRCVLPDAPAALAPGMRFDGPFLLEAEVATPRICLAVPGWIRWSQGSRAGTHFGVVFGDLDDRQAEGVQRFLIAAGGRRGSR
jgi:hypothetical protein